MTKQCLSESRLTISPDHGAQWQQHPSDARLESLQQALGRTFGNVKLLRLACRHPSCGGVPLAPPTLQNCIYSRLCRRLSHCTECYLADPFNQILCRQGCICHMLSAMCCVFCMPH